MDNHHHDERFPERLNDHDQSCLTTSFSFRLIIRHLYINGMGLNHSVGFEQEDPFS